MSDLRGFKDLPTFLAACDLPSDLRPWPVTGDLMAPRIKRGDFLLCRPVEHYVGDLTYVMIDGAITDAVRFDNTVRMTFVNKHYASRLVSAAWFDFMVLARAVHHLQCWDPLATRVMEAALSIDGRARA